MKVGRWIYVCACIMIGMALPAFLSVGGVALAQKPSSNQADKTDVFSGVVEEVDLKTTKIVIKTDVGKAVDLEVVKPELLKDIDKGDRITVTVDEKQRATKIMKNIPIPELKGPGSDAPPSEEKEGVQPGSR